MQCEDDQNFLSKERKQKKEDRRKKKKERLKDKQNSADVEQACDDVAQNTSPDVVSESSKKKRKREKQHISNSVFDETVCEGKQVDHSINGDGKIKRQKTDDIEQTTNCGAILEEIKSKKKKRKKEKRIPIDPSCDNNQQSGVSQDIVKSVKKKNKKSKDELSDGENVLPPKIDSTFHEIDCGINHEIKNKKQNHRVHLSKDEETEATKHTDSKENNSSPAKEESSKKKKKKKKHSKHKDCESVDETDSNNPRKKHKKKSQSTSCIDGSNEINDTTDKHDSVETHDVKHTISDVNISNTGDEKRSKHNKKQKNHSKNSPTALDMVKNEKRKQELCSEITKHGKATSDQMIKSEQSPNCAAGALGNWQGNLFENNERQNKFLRLLGGMKKSHDEAGAGSATLAGTKKKGLFGSLALLSNTASSGSSVALDVNAAASLNQKLEDEYNKAMNFKLSGKVGSGFGFAPDPAEGKKFHIDVNKSKSIKFDDD